ncbi:hypothetical protein A2U01_0059736, partial [Trifolium medium]|nr:hypothetical protein [Trifolium medium]
RASPGDTKSGDSRSTGENWRKMESKSRLASSHVAWRHQLQVLGLNFEFWPHHAQISPHTPIDS